MLSQGAKYGFEDGWNDKGYGKIRLELQVQATSTDGAGCGERRQSATSHWKEQEIVGEHGSTSSMSQGAKQELSLEIDSCLGLRVTDENIRYFVGLPHWFSNVSRWRERLHIRPDSHISSVPRDWWRYAITCMILGAAENKLTASMARMKEAKEYAGLFVRRFQRPWLTPLSASDEKRLQELEDELPLQVLLKQRTLAQQRLQHEEAGRDHEARDHMCVHEAVLSSAGDSWGAPDEVLRSGWMKTGVDTGKPLKKRWVVVVEVRRVLATSVCGWACLQSSSKTGGRGKAQRVDGPTEGVAVEWERLWFRLVGTVLEIYSDLHDETCRGQLNIERCSSVSFGGFHLRF